MMTLVQFSNWSMFSFYLKNAFQFPPMFDPLSLGMFYMKHIACEMDRMTILAGVFAISRRNDKRNEVILPDDGNYAINAKRQRHIQPALQIVKCFRSNKRHHVRYSLCNASGNTTRLHRKQFT